MPDSIKPDKPWDEMNDVERREFARRREDALVKEVVRQREEFVAWRKRWARRVLIGYLTLLVGIGYAVKTNSDAIDQINTERSTRQDTVSQIIAQNCNVNNDQDLALAVLVSASLQGGAGDFGAAADPNALTPFDVEVIASIKRIGEATPTPPTTQKFRHALRQLRDLQDCVALVNDYLAGNPIDTDPNEPGLQGLPEESTTTTTSDGG